MLTVVFWLITTALLASHSDDLNSIDSHATGLEGSRRKFFQDTIQSYAASFIHATYAATGTAAANFLLFVVTLVCFGMLCWRLPLPQTRCPSRIGTTLSQE